MVFRYVQPRLQPALTLVSGAVLPPTSVWAGWRFSTDLACSIAETECSFFVTLSRRTITMRAGCKCCMDRWFTFVTCPPVCFALGGAGISEHFPARPAQPCQVTAFWGEYPMDLLLLQATYEQFQRRRAEMAFLETGAENSSVLAFQTQLLDLDYF